MADNAELTSGSESLNQMSNSPTEKRRKKELVKLDYFIHKYSSFSSNYVPENIMINNPYDQSSRWSTNSNTPPQFLTLRLNSPAIVKTITFGKYMKTHVCNLQKFCVMGGMDDTNMSELFTGGLKNDSVPETFPLRHHTKDGLLLPVAFVSIVPHLSWGSAFNYTIWYVELRGDAEYVLIRSALQTISLRKEEEAVRLCLKHLRRRRYRGAYEALARETGVRLEGATPARLWDALVEDGDYDRAEAIMDEAIREGQLKWYVSWQPYAPSWRLLSACSPSVAERLTGPGEGDGAPTTPPPALPALLTYDRDWSDREPVATNLTETCDGCDSRPGPRGGHQLCVDSQAGALYLYGGWNGLQDLDDLWTYSIADEQWRLLCRHSEKVGGPSPRSCHKMVLDPVSGRIFTLGRYLDAAHRLPDNMKSDMYAYCVASNTWQLVCADTAAVGGPRLVFDHQMCIDADTGTIYVFGGRVLPASGEESGSSPQYSGLFAYHIRTNTWELLLSDSQQSLPARVGHSMLFHPTHRKLYIFAGQRNKEHLLDFVWFDVDTRRVGGAGSARGTTRPSPAAGFTQRATLDPDTDEIFVLSGLSKEKDRRVCNVLWVCSLTRRTWSCIYRNDCKQLAQLPAHAHPCPRFAHQLVYDTVNKVHYLFGGNPGQTAHPRLRLDDFWSLRLTRVSAATLQRRLRAELRRARYEELAAGRQSVAALRYLQTRVHEAFDHEDGEQAEEYRKLATTLFTGGNTSLIPTVPVNPSLIRKLRIRSRQVPQDWCSDSESSLTGALAAVLGVEGGDIEREDSPRCDARLDMDDTGLDEPMEPLPGPDYLAPDEARHWDLRQRRCELYDRLTEYFPRQCVPPKANLTDFVTL